MLKNVTNINDRFTQESGSNTGRRYSCRWSTMPCTTGWRRTTGTTWRSCAGPRGRGLGQAAAWWLPGYR